MRRLRLSRGTKDERGAILVETAISVILLAIIMAGILNYGTLFGDDDDLAGATRSATLAGTLAANPAPTDATILHTLIGQSGKKRDNIERVVIYKATTANGDPPITCTTMAQSDVAGSGQKCNVYLPADFSKDATTLAASPGAKGWPAASHLDGTDYLGVWIQATHTNSLNIVWAPTRYTDKFVALIQPMPASGSVEFPAGFVDPGNALPPNSVTWTCWNGQYSSLADSKGNCAHAFLPPKGPVDLNPPGTGG